MYISSGVLSFKYYCWTDIVVACILDVDLDIAEATTIVLVLHVSLKEFL